IDPLRHFCSNCGAPTGPFTSSMPFGYYVVLGCSMGVLWKRAFRPAGLPFWRRAWDALLLFCLGPVVLIAARVPLWRRAWDTVLLLVSAGGLIALIAAVAGAFWRFRRLLRRRRGAGESTA
ncbi:MAG: hypothetical protein ACE5JG_05050, partial [Planctomycetota bacterium]